MLQNIAYSVGMLSGSAHKILTQQLELLKKVCAWWNRRLTKEQKGYKYKNIHLFIYKVPKWCQI